MAKAPAATSQGLAEAGVQIIEVQCRSRHGHVYMKAKRRWHGTAILRDLVWRRRRLVLLLAQYSGTGIRAP